MEKRTKYLIVNDRLYTDSDEWVKVEKDVLIVGITDYAQKKLRDIIGVDLPKPNTQVRKGDPIAVVESVKAAADIYSPVDGTITEVNERLVESPELLNKDPYGEGWIFKIKPSGPLANLLTPENYMKKIGE
ncbi:glycine cleavage system protein H [Sulfodiicoccus acidiphilus]|uniref:Probable glycine cleavage system H protein n=1 Tax=Sulfodiicoccus acidiphilus TaxID=1670455 RepID=A0A348B3G8_9CREN|nr:glycine cleavage system protein GcvH [Sulfodiicoccus acidiphilus]BBD72720.1 glycine cleavage system protein H [Sulfodiicoccus acidiphilus]GGT95308.1 glycine cleavage system protein H [Sulfodiicoccus acidiphilus]